MKHWGSKPGDQPGQRINRLLGQLEDSDHERGFRRYVWPEESRQIRIALGFGVVMFAASLALEYARIGQGDAFFWSAWARVFLVVECHVALFASTRDEPGPLMAWSLVGAAVALALCGAVTILVGGLPWQDYAATTAVAMVYMTVFLSHRPAQSMLSVAILGFGYVGLLPFVEGAGNVARLVIVEGVVLFTCLVAIQRYGIIRRAPYLQGLHLMSARETSQAQLNESHFQRQTFEEAAADNVNLVDQLETIREDAERQSTFLRAVLDNISRGVSVYDKEWKLAVWNQQLVEMMDIPERLLKVGTPLADLMLLNAERGEYGDGDPAEIVAARMRKIKSGDITSHQYERRRPCGMVVEVRGNPMPGGGLVTTYTDITERKNAEEAVRKMALRDGLTGISNRNAFNQHLQSAIEEANEGGGEFALALFDLDDFKPVNDKYGHPVGDALLCHVAKVLRESVRDDDMAARLGGDEFAVLLRRVPDRALAQELVGRILKKLARPVKLDGHEICVGASAGLSIFPADASAAEDMIRSADEALYAAKAAGKNQLKLAAG